MVKQSPKAFGKLKVVLTELGFSTSKVDSSFFFSNTPTSCIWILVYIDDILDTGTNKKGIDKLIAHVDSTISFKNLGGLNSLDASDYSSERWDNIVKYYEELGKPSPKVEVTNFLKGREYTNAKSFPGE
ncbi:hypothetical protein PHJA_000730700 [Phtheirospermum japonicum]|uniref:Reverse transcriptase n=1 Tax=Phtheirospermum japonicum TaxID=374723 RepID=A0A830BKB5_9LAMI|nr:hypothetical protein PHJA_000730700 [Phtheirospermum japonicum]